MGAGKVWGGRDGSVGSRHTWGVLGERGYLRAGRGGVVGLVFYLQEEKFTYNPLSTRNLKRFNVVLNPIACAIHLVGP